MNHESFPMRFRLVKKVRQQLYFYFRLCGSCPILDIPNSMPSFWPCLASGFSPGDFALAKTHFVR